MRITFNSKPVIRIHIKDDLPSTATSMCVYSFTCTSGGRYIGRTTRRLSIRIREHNPRWLAHGVCKTTNSAILNHLLENNHRIAPHESFKVIFRVPWNKSKSVRKRNLATAEAVAIRLYKPILCLQKQFVRTLLLPWPHTNEREKPPITPLLSQSEPSSPS